MRSNTAPAVRAHAPIIERPHLVTFLDEGSDAQFTVVTAPAGSGKTVLVRSWVEGRGSAEPYAWVSVERGEIPNGSGARSVAEVGRSSALDAAVDELVPAPGFNAELLVNRLVGGLETRGNLTVVIDDLHEITSAPNRSGHCPPDRGELRRGHRSLSGGRAAGKEPGHQFASGSGVAMCDVVRRDLRR